MAKQTKRARKFVQSGGVKKRLEKGTITNKGKLKNSSSRKKKQDKEDGVDHANKKRAKEMMSLSEEKLEKRRQDDFTSRENLADLDMDSFFASFTEKKDGGDDEDNYEIEDDSSEDSGEDEKADDDDDDSSEDEPDPKKSKKPSPKSKPTKKNKASTKDDDSDSDSGSGSGSGSDSDSDSDSDSEDEDIEAAERRMKKEMGKLAENDPEFHEFLQENENALLEYGDDDYQNADEEEDADEDEDDDEDEDLVQTRRDKKKSEKEEEDAEGTDSNLIMLTADVLKKFERGAFESHGIKGLKKIVAAYKSACHMADGAHEAEDEKKQSKGKKYHIESSEIFDRLMVTCLNSVHEEIYYHLFGKGSEKSTGAKPQEKKKKNKKKKGSKDDDDDEDDEEQEDKSGTIDMSDDNKPLNPKLIEKSSRWKDIEPILFTFLKATMHVLAEAKEPELVTYILKALSKYLPYMTPFPRLGDSMLKTMTALWSAPIDASEDYQVVRLHSFLRIRQLALTQPFPLIEECLKKTYLAYAQRAKFANASSVTSTLPTLTFMGNCVVELYSLDYHSSYQHAFVYIRQLALLLRTAMQKKTPESFSAVYCWQYLHCLKLWVAVLTEACQARDDEDPAAAASATEEQLLSSLLFPLSQVILGTVRLIPSTRYLPLRLHCVRLLQQLAAATEVFLPTTAILLEAFDLRELSLQPQKVKKNSVQPLVLTFRLKKEAPLRTMEELEMCVSELFLLLNREVEIYQYSAGFPEFAVRICQRLRKFSKETRNSRWRAYSKGCIDVCERYSKRCMDERAKLQDVAPKDVKQLEVLRPVNVPSMGARYKALLEKEQRLEASTRPVQKQQAAKDTQSPDGDADKEGPARKKRKKNKNKTATATSSKFVAKEEDLLEEDEVKEGIDWSDDEE